LTHFPAPLSNTLFAQRRRENQDKLFFTHADRHALPAENSGMYGLKNRSISTFIEAVPNDGKTPLPIVA
jgi:hypothetical protein